MVERMTQAELESYLWGAATVLRGLVDAGDYKQYVFPFTYGYQIYGMLSMPKH